MWLPFFWGHPYIRRTPWYKIWDYKLQLSQEFAGRDHQYHTTTITFSAHPITSHLPRPSPLWCFWDANMNEGLWDVITCGIKQHQVDTSVVWPLFPSVLSEQRDVLILPCKHSVLQLLSWHYKGIQVLHQALLPLCLLSLYLTLHDINTHDINTHEKISQVFSYILEVIQF